MKRVQKSRFCFSVILLLGLGCVSTQTYSAGQVYTFGIVPQSSGSKLARLWIPILSYLKDKTGLELEFATSRNIPTFEKRLHNSKYDFAYMNPFQYTQVHTASGYNAFARAKDKRLNGIIVVRKNSPYQDLKDLAGKHLAFPSNAFAATLVTRAWFKNHNINIEPEYVASHDTAYRDVSSGRFAAGGGVMRTYNNTAKNVHDDLRVLWKSDSYTSHAFAALPRVPAEVVAKLQQAMLDMDTNPEGQALLKTIHLKGFESGQDSDWNDVRELHIEEQ